jgi:hypothetical protein
MEPPPAASSSGTAYLQPRKTPRRFTEIVRSKSSTETSVTSPGIEIAALLHIVVSFPCRSTAVATSRSTCSGCETSTTS